MLFDEKYLFFDQAFAITVSIMISGHLTQACAGFLRLKFAIQNGKCRLRGESWG